LPPGAVFLPQKYPFSLPIAWREAGRPVRSPSNHNGPLRKSWWQANDQVRVIVSNAPRTCPTPVAVSASKVRASVACCANWVWPQACAKSRLGRNSQSAWYVARPPARTNTSASTNFSLGVWSIALTGNSSSSSGSSTPARRRAYPNTASGTCFMLPLRLSVIGMRAIGHLLNNSGLTPIQAPNGVSSRVHFSREIRPIYDLFSPP
jgi:hypothetical protein